MAKKYNGKDVKFKKCGALWNKSDKNGEDYLAGEINVGILGQLPVFIFPNEKTEERHPDWSINILMRPT